MNYTSKDHTFVICAYKESQYLRECIESLMCQKMKTDIIMATSTPSEMIENISKEYNIPLFVNQDKMGGIAKDWNFAYSCSHTRLVTIAHQDDVYYPDYSKKMIMALNQAEHPLIGFSDYAERRAGIDITDNRLLNIKKRMRAPLRKNTFQSSIFVRRRVLSMGSAICCPSVTMVKDNLPETIFEDGFKSNIDWQAWERISRMKGQFVYCGEPLMAHRIHSESTTSSIIADNTRREEDYEMFRKFWPAPIAGLIEHFYREGEKQNSL